MLADRQKQTASETDPGTNTYTGGSEVVSGSVVTVFFFLFTFFFSASAISRLSFNGFPWSESEELKTSYYMNHRLHEKSNPCGVMNLWETNE